jgi:organic hydroperoxide reductase OsmC/OhrA
MEQEFAVTLDWREGFQFAVDFEQDGVAPLLTDEPQPLGLGAGPNPTRMLAAAVGNCMSASLKFCLDRAHIEVLDMKTHVTGTIVRNERGRMRIGSLQVRLEPVVAPADVERMSRCIGMFEDFCTVGRSVQEGIELVVDVAAAPASAAAAPGSR